jgi:hypothetical protein
MCYPESSTGLDAIEVSHGSALLASFTVVNVCRFCAVDDARHSVTPRLAGIYVVA